MLLAACLLSVGFMGCAKNGDVKTPLPKLAESFETTAHVRYRELDTIMTLYKKPLNCAQVTFESPESLRDLQMTFYTDKVALQYQNLDFQFTPGSLPGEAAAKLVLSALNTVLEGTGVTVSREDGILRVEGQLDEGAFTLTADAKNGNILKLSIPERELEMEVLHFKILE